MDVSSACMLYVAHGSTLCCVSGWQSFDVASVATSSVRSQLAHWRPSVGDPSESSRLLSFAKPGARRNRQTHFFGLPHMFMKANGTGSGTAPKPHVGQVLPSPFVPLLVSHATKCPPIEVPGQSLLYVSSSSSPPKLPPSCTKLLNISVERSTRWTFVGMLPPPVGFHKRIANVFINEVKA